MGDKTGIEWTDATWNPTVGCDRVSPGCDHCYAMTMAKRLKAMGQPDYQHDGDPRTSGPGFGLTTRPHMLDQPIRWRRPRKIFVNSMSDLFHEKVPDEFIARVFAVMAHTPQHTYQILTKRHGRMRALLSRDNGDWLRAQAQIALLSDPMFARKGWPIPDGGLTWPLPNVWLGVSVEDQKWADIRIPALLDTPAAVRFLSCEPLLGPIEIKFNQCREHDFAGGFCTFSCPRRQSIDWVIVGGESGAGARPMDREWVEQIRDDCGYSDTAFLFKQWGSHDERGRRMSKHAAGRLLDGRTWDEYPGSAASQETTPSEAVPDAV